MRFRDLLIGQEFDFDGGQYRSFTLRCKKVSARCYTWTDPRSAKTFKSEVGSINGEVYHWETE